MLLTGKERLVTYVLEITDDKERGGATVAREIIRYKRGRHGSPFHFLDFENGTGSAVTNEEDFDKKDDELNREEQTLESANILAIKGLGQFQRFKAASAFRHLIENWHVSDFHINMARERTQPKHETHLSESGDNLALVTQYLNESHPKVFDKIIQRFRDSVPGMESVQAHTTEDGYVLLRFQDGV